MQSQSPEPEPQAADGQERLLRQLRESEERYRAAFEQPAVGIVLSDLEGRVIQANDAFCRIVGRPIEQIVGRDSREYTHPDDREANVANLRQFAREGGTSRVFDKRYVRPDGTLVLAQISLSPVRDAAGQMSSLMAIVEDVTERRAVARSLAKARRRLDSALIAGEVGTYEWDVHGDRVYGDANFEKLFGVPLNEKGAPIDTFLNAIHADDRERIADRIHEAIRSGRDYEAEYRIVVGTGERWVNARAKVERDKNDQPVRLTGVLLDITGRKRAEAEAREERERIEFVIRGARVGVWYCPLPFDRLIWDERVKEHFHLPPDAEVTIDTFYERLHPDDRERTREAIARSIAEHQPYEIDYRTVSEDGRDVKWIRAAGGAFYDDDGTPRRFDGITTDVTERVSAQLALRESESRLADVVRTSLDCIVGMDHEGRVTEWNPAAEATFGYTCEEAMGQEMAQLIIPPALRERHRAGLANYLATGEGPVLNKRLELTAVRRDGTEFPVELTITLLTIADPPAFTGYIRDITDRKQAEAERESLLASERNARAEAERVSRMKDEFLATLSHEIRTPLNAILGWAKIMNGGDARPDDLQQGLEVIERNARAQSQIIEDLLDMSRIISGKVRLDVQRLDLAAIVRAAVDTARPAADAKQIRLQAILDPLHGVVVTGDASRLQQVLWNLLSNAVKFTPKRGRVQVVLERVNSHLEISVTDSGEGIKPEFLPLVFDRFRQADASTTRRHGGLGLGLSIVKQLVELHGGTVRVHSEGVGHGSTFIVSLPLPIARADPHPDTGERRHPRATATLSGMPDACVELAGVRVLVVDDEPDARSLVKRLLEDCDAIVTTAGSVAEAMSLVEHERFDVVVSDIGMPGEDGYTLIRRIRALGPDAGGDLPALALTAYARAEDRVRAISAGFQMHIAKPVEPVELITMVAGAAGRIGKA